MLQLLPVCKSESKSHKRELQIKLQSIGEVNQQFLEGKEHHNNDNNQEYDISVVIKHV